MDEKSTPNSSIPHTNDIFQRFSVIPLHGVKNGKCTCGNPDCHSPGKHPRISEWREYQTRKPTAEELARWKKSPGNFAIITGEVSGVFVLDVDGPEGEASLRGKHIPPTWMVRTGKGRHIYFRWPGFPVQNGVRILPGLDIRGDGGYAVAPGGIHASGRKYAWVDGLSPADLPPEPAEPPEWLLELLREKKPPGSVERIDPVRVLAGVPEGQRDMTLFRYACRLRSQGLSKEEALRLVLEAAANCSPPFPEREARLKVEQAWKYPEGGGTPEGFSAADLLRMDFPDPKWCVPGLLPEGLSILGGKPKIGKLWLALNLAVAVACGGKALGEDIEAGPVLYLSLEDTPRRLKNRLESVLNGSPAPKGLHFYTSWPKLDENGLTLLEAEILRREPRLVIIDTFQRIRPVQRGNGNIYGIDYDDTARLKELADRCGVAMVLVHHLKKASELDPVDMLSGSTGISGAADAIWILSRERGQADAVLYATGRDFEERELALSFDPMTTTWQIMGTAAEYRMTKERREILEVLREADAPMRTKDIAAMINKPYGTVAKLIHVMAKAGEIKTAGYGKYTFTTNINNNGKSGKSGKSGITGKSGKSPETFTGSEEVLPEVLPGENPGSLRRQGIDESFTSFTAFTDYKGDDIDEIDI